MTDEPKPRPKRRRAAGLTRIAAGGLTAAGALSLVGTMAIADNAKTSPTAVVSPSETSSVVAPPATAGKTVTIIYRPVIITVPEPAASATARTPATRRSTVSPAGASAPAPATPAATSPAPPVTRQTRPTTVTKAS